MFLDEIKMDLLHLMVGLYEAKHHGYFTWQYREIQISYVQ